MVILTVFNTLSRHKALTPGTIASLQDDVRYRKTVSPSGRLEQSPARADAVLKSSNFISV